MLYIFFKEYQPIPMYFGESKGDFYTILFYEEGFKFREKIHQENVTF